MRKIRDCFPLKPAACLLVLAGILLLLPSCHYYNLERKLSPLYKDFYSKVRYIITRQEAKVFLELPDSEKDAFIQEFWQRRDPDPGTEENEFKIEYENRVSRADELFIGEGKPGYLTDRGRIYVLFGPPMDRLKNPMGYSSSTYCSEVWFYGNFPVVFSDPTCTGNFKLVTYDLTSIRAYNLLYMHELSLAQAHSQQTIVDQDRMFNFEWSIRKTLLTEDRIEGKIVMNIPYANIWFSGEGDLLKTVLDFHFELVDPGGRKVWEQDVEKGVEIPEEELKADRNKKFILEIPFSLTGTLQGLRSGTSRMHVTLVNRTGGKKIKKFLDVKF